MMAGKRGGGRGRRTAGRKGGDEDRYRRHEIISADDKKPELLNIALRASVLGARRGGGEITQGSQLDVTKCRGGSTAAFSRLAGSGNIPS